MVWGDDLTAKTLGQGTLKKLLHKAGQLMADFQSCQPE